MKLFLQKNAKFSRAGGFAPKAPKQPPHCEFLAMRLPSKVKFSKMPCPRLEDSTIFDLLKMGQGHDLFFRLGTRQKPCGKILKTFFFGEHLRVVSLVLGLGLELFFPWPRESLSSKGRFLASNFFVSLALASSLVSSTPPLVNNDLLVTYSRPNFLFGAK